MTDLRHKLSHTLWYKNSVRSARRAFERFRFRWRGEYPAMVNQLERDLPELLNFY